MTARTDGYEITVTPVTGHQASCTCGWVGPVHTAATAGAEAREDGTRHRIEHFAVDQGYRNLDPDRPGGIVRHCHGADPGIANGDPTHVNEGELRYWIHAHEGGGTPHLHPPTG